MMTELAERVHQRVWDLLPWYANGSLAAAEKEMVESHLAGCANCRHEVESCRQLQLALRQAEEAVPSPHPVQLARLMARLDEPPSAGEIDDAGYTAAMAATAAMALPAAAAPNAPGASPHDIPLAPPPVPVPATPLAGRTPASPLSPLGPARRRPFTRLLAATPPAVRWALAAQLVLLLSLAAMQAPRLAATLGPARQRPTPDYITLSQETAPPRGPEIRIVFAEVATERQIRDLLLRIGGHLIDGPSPLGTYTVQIAGGAAGKDSLDYVLSYLRAQPTVRFAQPVAGSLPETPPGTDSAAAAKATKGAAF